ncbi:transposase [Deinococcus cavernae]|nr:transposase [Deinococcus cavernae]
MPEAYSCRPIATQESKDAKKGEKSVEELCRDLGCSTASFYAWKKKYGDTSPDEARRLLGQNGLA